MRRDLRSLHALTRPGYCGRRGAGDNSPYRRLDGRDGGSGDEDRLTGAKPLFAFALFGFGLLLSEFELLLFEAGRHEVCVGVDHWEVQLRLFVQALDQGIGIETVQDGEEIDAGDVDGG